MARHGGRMCGVAAVLVSSLLVTVGPAAAAVLVGIAPQLPPASTVGQNVPGLLAITNTSSGLEATGTVTVSNIRLVPSCGTIASVDCPVSNSDPGVFQVTQALGSAGACAGVSFVISTVDAAQGKLQFTPAAPLTLGAPGSPTDNCRIDLLVTVLKRPAKDAQPGTPGVQTDQLASASVTSSASGLTVLSTGVGMTTVNRATSSLTTLASPQTAAVGQTLTDTATVTGVSGGPTPTSGVNFTVFADPPGAAPCSGPSQNLGLIGTAAAGGSPPTATATSPPVTTTGVGTYRFVVSYIGDANYESLPDSPCGAAGENVVVALPSGRYVPLTPARILDTRDGTGGVVGPIGSASTTSVQITGRGGVPASGVSAVAMNVTVTQPTGSAYLTLYPTGTDRPLAANLNYTPGKTVPNLVVVKLGTGGKVDMFNSVGTTHVIYDVTGYFTDDTGGSDGRYVALTPARILDTRNGTGGSSVRLGPGASLELQVLGVGGVPALGVEAVVMNVAVTNTDATSYLTVFPLGEPRPLAANLNWTAGDTVSNRVIAKVGNAGRVMLYNNAGSADIVVDTNGWFSSPALSPPTGVYTPLTPARILDTRDGTGGVTTRPGGSTADVQVTGVGGVPAAGVNAVILNATVVNPAGPGYLTVYPAGTTAPLVSDLNYATGEIRPNLVVVKLGTGGKVSLFTPVGTDVVFDVAGYFT